MFKDKKILKLQLVSYLIFCDFAYSEELDIKKDPVTIPIGALDLSPVLEVGETFNDNIFTRDTVKKSSFITQTNAGAQLAFKRQSNRYALTYALQNGQYHASPQDDYLDHYAGLNTHTEFTSRNRLDTDMSYFKSHYMRGAFLGRDLTSSIIETEHGPDQYHMYDTNAKYTYGAVNAPGNLEVKAGFKNYTFDNNPTIKQGQDRNNIDFGLGYNYKVLPNTTLHAQFENNWVMHKSSQAGLYDTNKQRFLVGGTWVYSTQLKTVAKIGYLHQAFDSAALSVNNLNALTWDLGLIWSPLSYSKVNISMNRDARSTVNSANIREADRYNLGWTHEWNSRISTQLSSAYENANNIALHREDNFYSVTLDLNYGVRRWLGVGVILSNRNLDSQAQTLNFDQNTVLFYVTGNPRLSDDVKTPWTTWY
jgi:hypothetical protein